MPIAPCTVLGFRQLRKNLAACNWVRLEARGEEATSTPLKVEKATTQGT